jgi:hypothetical protein
MSDKDFQEAFEASKKRVLPDKINVKVMDLQPGDLVTNPFIGQFMFVCKGVHPIWSNLQAVVWCSNQGELSIDALRADQVIAGGVTNRNETPAERGRRFRMWYFDKQGKPRGESK